ncbi:MAG: Maf family protein [Erysipelotrichaceae bacterium]|nr:Maf family protein [Erysipelotrichaceae bacterium]
MKLILASGSPRRKELLSNLNIPFDIIVADIDESIDHSIPLRKEIERLSYEKAYAVFKDHEDSTVIGSDTIVTLNEKHLGKPKNEEDAFNMLKELQNNKHAVITAVSIISKDKVDTFSVVSDVYFNEMSDEEIREYIKTGEPMDKAGAYAIQGIGSKFIKKIDGDYYAIMGLPVSEVYNKLKEYK